MTPDAVPIDEKRDVRRARWIVIAGTAVLALLIIGPLLRPGILLLLDTSAASGAKPKFAPWIWGFPPGPPSQAPVELVVVWLNRLIPLGVTRLVPLALVPVCTAWGFYRLLDRKAFLVLAATVFFVFNPFTYERMVAGHLFFLLGAALLPLLLSYVLARPGPRNLVKASLTLASIWALSLHFVFIAGVLVIIAGVLSISQRHRAFLTIGSVFGGLVLSVYWIVPLLFSDIGQQRLSTAHLEAFQTNADPRWGLIPNVLGLYGFWRRGEWPLPKDHISSWPFLLLVLLLVAGVGFVAMMRDPSQKRLALCVAGSGLVGLVLSLGSQGPTGGTYTWLYEHVPGFAAMREPQKFLVLLALAYATLFAYGVRRVVDEASSPRGMAVAATVLLLLPIAYGFRGLFGFFGFAKPSHYPASWRAADRIMGDGSGLVWALPWHLYVQVPWAQGRALANPMQSYFQREVLSSNDPELGDVEAVAPTQVESFITDALKQTSTRRIGSVIAPLGVEYVLLAKWADYEEYGWLDDQKDLQVVEEWRDLVLYRNDALRHGGAYTADGDLDVPLRRQSPARYEVLKRAPEGPLLTRLTPVEGWKYQGVRARPHLGVTAAFDVDRVRAGAITYGPWAVVRAGYISGSILLLVVILWLVRSRAADEHEPKHP